MQRSWTPGPEGLDAVQMVRLNENTAMLLDALDAVSAVERKCTDQGHLSRYGSLSIMPSRQKFHQQRCCLGLHHPASCPHCWGRRYLFPTACRIITVGNQSTGKSTLLEAVCGDFLSLPKGQGMVTRSPIQLSLRNNIKPGKKKMLCR
jgi:hypothetical protein